MIKRTRPVAVLSALLALAFGCAAAADAFEPAPDASVVFDVDIPLVTEALPLFALRPASDPTAAVNAFLSDRGFGALQPDHDLLVARSDDALRAEVDPRSGDATAFPDLSNLPAAPSGISTAKAELLVSTLIEKDATQFRAATMLTGERKIPTTTVDDTFGMYGVARFAAGRPVYGPGSRLTVAVAPDGSVRGFLRRWKPASRTKRLIAPLATVAEIKTAVERALAPYANDCNIHVTRIDQAYYDANQAYLQPVYRYVATLHAKTGTKPDRAVAGYVPIGIEPEPIDQSLPDTSSFAALGATFQVRDGARITPDSVNVARQQEVLGYRTTPLLDTRRQSGFDHDVALGADPATAWLIEAAADQATADGSLTHDGNGQDAGFNRPVVFIPQKTGTVTVFWLRN